MTILIANATSRTSRFVLRALLAEPDQSAAAQPRLRLHARSESSLKKLEPDFPQLADKATSRRIEYTAAQPLDVSALQKAMEGVDVVWYNGPAFVSQATAMGIAMVDAALGAGVKHFVFCSVLHPLLSKLVNHIEKLPCVFNLPVSSSFRTNSSDAVLRST
jgi:uncharacterized protein YbjT (DUF2867 family)